MFFSHEPTKSRGVVGIAIALGAALTACSGSDNTEAGDSTGGAAGLATNYGSGGSTATAVASGGTTTVPASTGGSATGVGGMLGLPTGMGGMLGLPSGAGGMLTAGAGGMDVGGAGTGTAGMGVAGMMAAGGAGMGGAGGTAGAAGGGGAGGMHADLGVGDGTDVVLLGDSWMSNTLQIEGTGGGLAPSLIAAAKKPYRNYAVQGVMMLMADSFGPAIPTQWDQAKGVNATIKTVVMTGGGNDIIQNATLQADCMSGGDMCKMVFSQISDALNTLWTKMADSNVQDIVYVQYASDVGTVAQSVRMGMKVPDICSSGRIRCSEVDSTSAVMHQIAADGIHPLQAANDRLAKVVYDLMTSEGIRR